MMHRRKGMHIYYVYIHESERVNRDWSLTCVYWEAEVIQREGAQLGGCVATWVKSDITSQKSSPHIELSLHG